MWGPAGARRGSREGSEDGEQLRIKYNDTYGGRCYSETTTLYPNLKK